MSIYNLKHVDYAERGQQVEIIVDGVPKRQTIIFSGTDYFGEKYYFTEQGLRYIQDSRHKLPWQNFVLNYLQKIPIMTRQLNFNYDARDFLQIWNPALDSNRYPDFESGLYATFGSAKLKGAKHAFDSIMIDDFSKAYSSVIVEIKRKEPPIEQENYDVPELGLYQVQLSRILEEIYCRFVEKKTPSRQKAEVLK